MNTFTPRDNSGALFVASNTSPQQSDRTGSVLIAGREYGISAWIKEGARGKSLSLAFSPKSDAPPNPPPKDDDIDW